MGKTGNEPLTFNGESTGLYIRDFWSWGFSNLLDNTLRGIYAEFIVAAALDIDLSAERVNWEPWDLTMRCECDIHVEVKSSSYVQIWQQKHPSSIRFSIRPSMMWTTESGYSGKQSRMSDVYVFCVYTENNATRANPMRLEDWEFYVVSTKKLDNIFGAQKSIALSSLLQIDPVKTDFAGLKATVLRCVQQ